MSGFLWPHGPQHARRPCPSPTPRVYSNSCSLSLWCHPTISSSVVLENRAKLIPASTHGEGWNEVKILSWQNQDDLIVLAIFHFYGFLFGNNGNIFYLWRVTDIYSLRLSPKMSFSTFFFWVNILWMSQLLWNIMPFKSTSFLWKIHKILFFLLIEFYIFILFKTEYILWSSVQFSLRPYGLQHARLPCSSPTLGACSNSCPWSRWCHPTISYSVLPFSSCLQSFPESGSFLMSQFFTLGAKVLELQLQHQSFQ